MPRVVSNTTPLQYLHRIGKLEILRDLFGTVIVPVAVATEIARGKELGHDLPDIPSVSYLHVQGAAQRELAIQFSDLGAGEVEAILLGSEMPHSLVLLDDADARSRARLLGLEVLGTLGVLVEAKRRNLLMAVSPLIEQARNSGFRVSDAVVKEIRRLAGE